MGRKFAMKKQQLPQQLQVWADARQRYHLSDAQVQMAREMGLNPLKFGKLANEKQEPWKAPLPEFIEHIYFKRFGKTVPDKVLSLEAYAQELERKKEAKRQRKQLKKLGNTEPTTEGPIQDKESDSTESPE